MRRGVLVEFGGLPENEAARWNACALDELIRHIVERHHVYLRSELQGLERSLLRVANINDRADANTLAPLTGIFRFFKRELELHLKKEEDVLFPMIERIETAAETGAAIPRFTFGSIANPIGIMEEDHEGQKRQLMKILELSGNYTGPPGQAAIFSSFCERLQALDTDMQRHVYLEDEILFPRVLLLEGKL